MVLHGTIWDEANEKAKELVRDRGLTYVHPFDDLQLIAGQGTLGLEIIARLARGRRRRRPDRRRRADLRRVDGGEGVQAVGAKVIGVESSGAPGMHDSVRKRAAS